MHFYSKISAELCQFNILDVYMIRSKTLAGHKSRLWIYFVTHISRYSVKLSLGLIVGNRSSGIA